IFPAISVPWSVHGSVARFLHRGGASAWRPQRVARGLSTIREDTGMTPAEVLGLIKEKEIKFVDFRFTDTKGKEQHVTVPARTLDEDVFEEGKMFDGSSIAGWKGINESDMVLMPDPASAVVEDRKSTRLNTRHGKR